MKDSVKVTVIATGFMNIDQRATLVSPHLDQHQPDSDSPAHFAMNRQGFAGGLDDFEGLTEERGGAAGSPSDGSMSPAIQDALRETRAVVVCLGPHGLGRVHDSELQVALDQAWRDPERLVIPVLLPGFEGEVPEFLRLRTWVDLRPALGGGELEKLVRTLEGQPGGPPERAVAADEDGLQDPQTQGGLAIPRGVCRHRVHVLGG